MKQNCNYTVAHTQHSKSVNNAISTFGLVGVCSTYIYI